MMTDEELGAILNVRFDALDAAVRTFVANVIKLRGHLAPIVFLRATRNPRTGAALPKPMLTAVVIEGGFEDDAMKQKIAHTVRKVAGATACEWVVFLLPGMLVEDDGAPREIMLCVTEHDGGNFAFAGYIDRKSSEVAEVTEYRSLTWSVEQKWLGGMLEQARERRLDLS
jgi:hypothetical protein